jgi:tetratricopeptide (TPR) repeat protein
MLRPNLQSLKRQTLMGVIICLPLILLTFLPIAPRPFRELEIVTRLYQAELLQNHEKAAQNLRLLTEFYPQRVEWWERLAFLELKGGNPTQAVADFERAWEAQAISENGLFTLIRTLFDLGETNRAVEFAMVLVEKTDLSAEYFPQLMQIFQKVERWDLAVQAAQRWAAAEPENTQAVWLTAVLQSYRMPEEAIRLLTPLSASRGSEARQAARLLEALETAQENPDPAYQRVVIGQRLGELGYWDVAEQAFLEAIDSSPDYAEGWALLAEARQNLGKDGYPALRRAFELNPVSDIIQTAMALYWRRQDQPLVALGYLRVLAEKHPTEGRWQVEIGAALAQSGDLVEALHAYRRAVEIEPENAELWRSLAVFSASNGFDPQSYTLPAAQRALDLDGNNPASLDTAGYVYLLLGEWKDAEQFLQQALKVDESYAPALLHLGQVYLEMGRTSQAFQYLKRASESRDEVIALTAKRLLQRYFPDEVIQP